MHLSGRAERICSCYQELYTGSSEYYKHQPYHQRQWTCALLQWQWRCAQLPEYFATTNPPLPFEQVSYSTSLQNFGSNANVCRSTSAVIDAFFTELVGIANSSSLSSNCSKCIAGAEVLHLAAITQPVSAFTELLIRV